jgi:signal transduction histidine kinase
VITVENIIREVSRIANPDEALKRLLKLASQATDALNARLYTLQLARFKYAPELAYDPRFEIASVPSDEASVSLDILDGKRPSSELERVIVNLSSSFKTADPRFSFVDSDTIEPMLIVPIVRGESCLGLFQFKLKPGAMYNPATYKLAETLAAFSVSLLEKRSTLALLSAMQVPLNYNQPFDTFMDEILLLVADAAQVPYITIRELDRDANRLKCVAMYGFPSQDKSTRDLDPLDAYPTFARALDQLMIVVEPSIQVHELDAFRSKMYLDRLQSLVVAPISLSAKKLFGTFSLGTSCKYFYSESELKGFESIATLIGTAIANYRHIQERDAASQKFVRVTQMMTAGNIASGLAHELKNGVASIVALAQSVERDPSIRSKPSNIQTLDRLLEETKDLFELAKRLLNVARAEDLTWADAYVNEIVQDTCSLIRPLLAAQGLQLELQLDYTLEKPSDGQGLRVSVVRTHIGHVLRNLILNGADASFKNQKIVVSSKRLNERQCEISVRDFGVGIAPEARKHLYELFYTTKQDGFGIGLHTARMLVQQLGGTLEFDSKPGAGATFSIRLPLIADREA